MNEVDWNEEDGNTCCLVYYYSETDSLLDEREMKNQRVIERCGESNSIQSNDNKNISAHVDNVKYKENSSAHVDNAKNNENSSANIDNAKNNENSSVYIDNAKNNENMHCILTEITSKSHNDCLLFKQDFHSNKPNCIQIMKRCKRNKNSSRHYFSTNQRDLIIFASLFLLLAIQIINFTFLLTLSNNQISSEANVNGKRLVIRNVPLLPDFANDHLLFQKEKRIYTLLKRRESLFTRLTMEINKLLHKVKCIHERICAILN